MSPINRFGDEGPFTPDPNRLPGPVPSMVIGPRGKWSLRDFHAVPIDDQARAKVLLGDMLLTMVPPEIFCQTFGMGPIVDGLIAHRGEAAIAAFRAIENDRVTEVECRGDVSPIRLIVYEGDRLVGAWEWYAITRAGMSPARLSAMPWPAFHKMGLTVVEQMALAADVCELFLNRPELLIAGTSYQVVEVRFFSFTDEVTMALAAEFDARDTAGRLDVTMSTNAWGREKRLITRVRG